jgi:prepilin-type N-terminal cleavage/methylation domain-containing protein
LAARGFTLIELLVVIAIIGILASIVLVSLSSARGGANDARIKEQLSGMRTAMETYYLTNNNYGTTGTTDRCAATPAAPWDDATTGLISLGDEDNYPANSLLVCVTSGTAWGASARLANGTEYYCVDSTGIGRVQATAGVAAATTDVTCN